MKESEQQKLVSAKDLAKKYHTTQSVIVRAAERAGYSILIEVDIDSADDFVEKVDEIKKPYVKAGLARMESMSPAEQSALGRLAVETKIRKRTNP